ncbi:MAG: hypothetical protein LBP92_01530 [Deltaproteobacteria bacterium]|nr:hypothetical protein [Deltaproteobacteria bacterium]
MPALLALLALALSAGTLAAAAPDRDKYQVPPFLGSGQVSPRVLLVLSKELKMFQHGYPGLVDFDGDGRVDTGFNPGVEYVGYFDSGSCYGYRGARQRGLNGFYMSGDSGGYFFRVGAAIEDQSQAQIQMARPSGLKSYVVSPRSVSGVCSDLSRSVTDGGQGTFSGNWLNYLATSRMDAITKILYGGRRSVDSASRTVLEHSFVPPDSTVWGSEVRSDDTWMEVTPLSAWYDIRKYTPFDRPASGKAHFFARGSDLGRTNGYFPALRVLLDADRNSFDLGGQDSVGMNVTVTEPHGRYWDWVLVNRPLPDDKVLRPRVREGILVYNLHVEVCDKANLGPGEGCMRYPGLSGDPADAVYKPAGLLQRYGGGGWPMSFGLLTGGYNSDIRNSGGKLRNHIGPVSGLPSKARNVYVPPVNSQTGQVNDLGLIRNIDNLRISGRPTNKDPASWDGERYYNVFSWGNPLGEMLYEGVRYLAGATTPSFAYNFQNDHDEPGSSILGLTSFGNWANSWNSLRPDLGDSSCAKPIILLISDITTEHDGDQFGSPQPRPMLPGIRLPKGLSEAANLPRNFDKKTYLDTVSRLEGITGGGDKYLYSAHRTDTCAPKGLGSLSDVRGLCPLAPSGEGTYSAVAAAYYAHIHDFNLSSSAKKTPVSVDVYSVTMSASFPELTFQVGPAGGGPDKSVSILPASIVSEPSSAGRILSFLNYLVLEWETDRHGQAFHAKIKVNFSDRAMGDDWEGDAQVTYEIDLLTDGHTPAGLRETTPVSPDSGDRALLGRSWYRFRNPASADQRKDFIEIAPHMAKAILVRSSWEEKGTGMGMAMGYTISGTTRDGTYMDLTMNDPPASLILTPPNCPYVGASASPSGCTMRVRDVKRQARVFALGQNAARAKTLPNPLWLAAKYGGFNDLNGNGVPDPGEWEGPSGDPRNYFQASNIAQLPEKLEKAFRSISSAVSFGVANTAAVNSVLGGGLSVQSYYYPRYVNPKDPGQAIVWVGGVYALFIDRFGNYREDSDGDGRLTMRHDPPGHMGDSVVSFSSPEAGANPPACHVPGRRISRCADLSGENSLSPLSGPGAHPESIHRLRTVFDTAEWLARLDGQKLLSGSRPWGQAATVADGRRLVYYGQPQAGGGATLARFNVQDSLAALDPLMLPLDHGAVLPGLQGLSRREATRMVIEYVIGRDQPGWRPRTVGDPWGDGLSPVTWRHGDVINSKPVMAGAPALGFDLLHGDRSYTEYRESMATRRQVLYYGANDGMLHAVNMGFLGSLSSGQVHYRRRLLPSQTDHELGAELWSFVPTSLLPHLQWLADPDYLHSYYVDLKPMVTDVKIGDRWRTILLVGLRLGGRPIGAAARNGPQGDHYFSEIVALDVTDPEKEPRLMWRHGSLGLGLPVGMPAVVRVNGRFYAILASGPVTDSPAYSPSGLPMVRYGQNDPQGGHSAQRARLIVLDVETGREVVNTDPAKGGRADFLVAPEPDSFFNEPFVPLPQTRGDPWNNHAVYYGLTASRAGPDCLDKGALYRLQMADALGNPLPVSRWRLARLFDAQRPISGAANSTRDRLGQLWVLFGTGRLWTGEDADPCRTANSRACRDNHQQFLYGIKEVLTKDGLMAFADRTPEASRLLDVSGATVLSDGTVRGLPAQPRLLATQAGGAASYAAVLEASLGPKTIGYRRRLDIGRLLEPGSGHEFEMILSQPKVAGLGDGDSVMAFTSFEPSPGACGSIGQGYQYAVDTFTGLPSPRLRSSFHSLPGSAVPRDVIAGAIPMGQGRPTEAVILTAEDRLILRGSNSDGGVFDIEIPAPGSALSSGLTSWREVLDVGIGLPDDAMAGDLP